MKRAAVARALLDLVLPPSCLGCSEHLVSTDPAAVLCAACQTRLRPPPPPRCPRCDIPQGSHRAPGRPCPECVEWPGTLLSARTAVILAPPASRLVHALKYEGWRRAAGPMATRMADRIVPSDAEAVLVPIPTTSDRLRTRGYNQAAVLAGELALRTGLPLLDALERKGGGSSQVSLHPSQRRTNVRDAFRTGGGPGPGIQGRRVLLVDDVLTTGATASAASRVLDEGGAAGVGLLAFARALPGGAGTA